MIIKLAKVVSCSSEHPSYPATNLLQSKTNASWRCAKPGEMLATVILQLAESSCITGVDIGNYHSCVVIVTASTAAEPDNWLPIVNYQFMTHEQAADGEFTDQVQLFTKRELNPDILKVKFDRIKVTCMQSANMKELFGLSFITLRTEVVVDWGLDSFGRFKLRQNEANVVKSPVDEFREKYKKMMGNQKANYKDELLSKIKESGMNNFSKRQSESREPMKRPLLEKLEAGKADEVFGAKDKQKSPKKQEAQKKDEKPVLRSPFGDVIPSPEVKANKVQTQNVDRRNSGRKRSVSPEEAESKDRQTKKPQVCTECDNESEDRLCKTCNKVPKPKPVPRTVKNNGATSVKPKKPFGCLMEDISFSLSGYVNPQRDEIRRKALQMGARYVADPNTHNRKCTHLVCAFKKTPKYQQLKGHSKIISHTFIEDCFDQRKRLPWRKYALDKSDQDKPESEEEIEACSTPPASPNVFDVDTDPDSDV